MARGGAVLTTAGTVARGWPYQTRGDIGGPACCTDCFPSPLFDLSDAGTLYLVPWDGDRSTVIALDADGRMLPGWPRRLARSWMPWGIGARADGGVDISVADTTGPAGACTESQQTITLAADGTVVRDVGVSTFAEVYGALRPQRLRTAGGATTFAAGESIQLTWDLVNTSRGTLVLPYEYVGEGGYEWAYVAGVEQTWLERLGPDPRIPCITSDWRRGTWYDAGGVTVATETPVTLPAGAALERTGSHPDLSACLEPGTYRVHVELHALGYDAEFDDHDGFEPLGEATLDFRIAGPPPTPSPSPSPRPTPTPSPSPRPALSPSPDASPAP